MKLEIDIKKKHAYGICLFVFLLVAAISVVAFGGTNPAVIGHSALELIVNSTSIVDGSIVNADVNAAAAIAGSKLGSDTVTGTQVDESTLGTVPGATSATFAGNSNACSSDATCEGNAFSGTTFSGSSFAAGSSTLSSLTLVMGDLTIRDSGTGGGSADIEKTVSGEALEISGGTLSSDTVAINPRLLVGAVGGAASTLHVAAGSCTGPSEATGTCDLVADLAEMFNTVDGSRPEQGTIVILDVSSSRFDKAVKVSDAAYDAGFIGVVSDNPTVIMGHGAFPVGLVGVVRTKVSAENGLIRKGDLLTTAHTAGHAMKCDEQCDGLNVIGRALEDLNVKAGSILVLIK